MSNPEWTQNIDLGSPGIQAFIKQGYVKQRNPGVRETKEYLLLILKYGNNVVRYIKWNVTKFEEPEIHVLMFALNRVFGVNYNCAIDINKSYVI